MKKSTAISMALAFALVCGVVLAACGFGPKEVVADTGMSAGDSDLDIVVVTGKAEVKSTPDKASVNVGATVKESTAGAANTKLGSKSDAIIKALKNAGIPEKDIKTSSYYVETEYKWENNERKTTGYRGSCSIDVTGIDISKVESIIDAAVNAGADSVGRVRYYSSTYDASYNQALQQAIKDARAKADAMGEAGGFKVIRVHYMQEGYQNDSVKYVETDNFAGDIVASESTNGASISVGSVSVGAYVTIQYVIG